MSRPATPKTAGRVKPGNGSPKALAAALISSQDAERAIVAALRRATAGITMSEVAQRTGQSIRIIRPSMGSLVFAGTVIASPGKPGTYRLNDPTANSHAGVRTTRNTTRTHGNYSGAELQRNPGISADRYAAFDLPSRMGDRLHHPDGRIEAMPSAN